MKPFALLGFVFSACLIHVFATQCALPPSHWCSSVEVAKKCKVENQCFEHISSAVDMPVKLDLYYESLCPYCKKFIKEQMWPAYKQIGHIMNISIIPYGNAKEEQQGNMWKYTCQHGTEECSGNLIEVCAMYMLKNFSMYFPFISCMESSNMLPEQSAKQCASQYMVDADKLMDCAKGQMGNTLEHYMAQLTMGLNPPHTFVPWIVVNGMHNNQIQLSAQTNLIKFICETYKGTMKPSACSMQSEVTRKD